MSRGFPIATSLGLCSRQLCMIFLVLSLCPGSPGRPYSEQIVEPGQGLQEDVGSLVGELVAAGDKEVQGLVQVEVQVPREATQGWVRLRPSPSSSGLETTNPRNSRGKKDHRQSGGHMETPGICGSLMLSWGSPSTLSCCSGTRKIKRLSPQPVLSPET